MSPAMTLNSHNNARINCAFMQRFVPPSRQQFHRRAKGAVPTPRSLSPGARAGVAAVPVAGARRGGRAAAALRGHGDGPGGWRWHRGCPRSPAASREAAPASPPIMPSFVIRVHGMCERAAHLLAAPERCGSGLLYVTVTCWKRGAAEFSSRRRV